MTNKSSLNSFATKSKLKSGLFYHSLRKIDGETVGGIDALPYSIKILLESLLRHENGLEVSHEDVLKLAKYNPANPTAEEISFNPARVLMQDFTGVPAIVDLAALRSAMERMKGDPRRINPVIPVDLVIDHSVQVDYYGSADALGKNSQIEFERNRER